MKQTAHALEIEQNIRDHCARVGHQPPNSIEIDHRHDREPNWFARAVPELRDFDDRRAFIAAVFQVGRLYDLDAD